MRNIENIVMLDTTNVTLYCYEHDRYIFDKEIEVNIECFEGETYRFPMHRCKKHPFASYIYYRWKN